MTDAVCTDNGLMDYNDERSGITTGETPGHCRSNRSCPENL